MQPDRNQNLSPRAQRGEELNQKLGLLWSRFWSVIVGIAGLALMAWFFTSAENKTPGGTVFIVAIGVGMLFVARHLWNNRDGLTEMLDGAEPPRE
ncbi:MAG: hypothetical protein KJO09_00595 [Gammaproteobacteria bacterium]|nr:hypothetical protein [Gammaproteobacteria bacterium]